jgi:polyisoprenoid-binding protein YceI
MKKLALSMATLLVLTAVFAFSLAQNWEIKKEYSIKFSNDGVSGIFKTFSGSIVFDDKNPATSKFAVTIDVASINTGNGLQNKHAKGDEWFDAAKYPQIAFTSSKIAKAGAAYQVTGTLDMHGVKKEIIIPFTFVPKGAEGVFNGTFTVNRNDYKIGKPGGDVGDQLKIEVSVPVVKK